MLFRSVSAHITVRSIVDRFLEHSRIFYFENGCRPEVFLSSADWMPRNFYRRIETAFPIEDGNLRDRIIHELLALTLADNTKARFLQADGSYRRPAPQRGAAARRSQTEFMALACNSEKPKARRAKGKAGYPKVKLATPPPAGRKK